MTKRVLRQRKPISELDIPPDITERHGIKPTDTGYLIEPEILKLARLYAIFYSDRYHWKYRFIDQYAMGLSQAIFETILQDLQVPYVHNQPHIDRRHGERERSIILWDFYVPGLGIIDIKSGWEYPNIAVNCSDWLKENPDFMAGVYFIDMPNEFTMPKTNLETESWKPENPTKAWLLGCMDKINVQDPNRKTELKSRDPEYRRHWLISTKDAKWENWKDFEAKLKLIAKELKTWKPKTGTLDAYRQRGKRK